ncbi:hypothetical protein SDJN03_12688, partial [Cucurbita argyrosperma subsp. sororia]
MPAFSQPSPRASSFHQAYMCVAHHSVDPTADVARLTDLFKPISKEGAPSRLPQRIAHRAASSWLRSARVTPSQHLRKRSLPSRLPQLARSSRHLRKRLPPVQVDSKEAAPSQLPQLIAHRAAPNRLRSARVTPSRHLRKQLPVSSLNWPVQVYSKEAAPSQLPQQIAHRAASNRLRLARVTPRRHPRMRLPVGSLNWPIQVDSKEMAPVNSLNKSHTMQFLVGLGQHV